MRKHAWILVLLLSIIVLTGCWSRKEISGYAIVSGVYIDKNDSGYEVSIQVINAKEVKAKPGGSAPFSIFTARGKTISEAIARISKICPREVYLGHFRTMVISERLARDGISKELDYFRRKVKVRSDFLINVLKGDIKQNPFVEMLPLEQISAGYIFYTQQNSERQFAASSMTRLFDLITIFNQKGKDAVLPAVNIIGKPSPSGNLDTFKATVPPTLLNFSGVAIFREDKLQGFLNENETILYNMLYDKVKLTNLVIPCENNKNWLAYSIDETKTSFKSKYENEAAKLSIHSKVDINVEESGCMLKINDPKALKQLENKIADDLTKKITKLMNRIRHEYKADLLGFGEMIHRSNAKQWKKISDQWAQLYADAELDIKVSVAIRDVGSILNPDFVQKRQ